MTKKKIGRNDPCPCGSGKKYKKCHLASAESSPVARIPPEVLRQFDRARRERQERERLGIYKGFPQPVSHQGRKVWALGAKIYQTDNPNQTFHEFILGVLRDVLGASWWKEEMAKSPDQRHFIVQCYSASLKWKQETAESAIQVRPGVWQITPDGLTQHLLSFAFDVATLLHDINLPDRLLKRLRHRDQYQGARYEVAIASTFVRVGCDVRFLDGEDASEKHVEFEARFPPTDEVVAVEAKSRHRKGVLHQAGAFDAVKAYRGDVRRLFREALQQDPGTQPFVVFIDLNSPTMPSIDLSQKEWFEDIQNMLDKHGTRTADRPDPWSLLCVTNFSYHYEVGREVAGGEHVLVKPAFSRHPISDQLLDRLGRAISNHGSIPTFDLVKS